MIYIIKNIQFEASNQQVLVSGQVMDLSPRGHLGLLMFLGSDNQILSKELLLETLWKNVIVSEDSLFKVIQEIRKALREVGLNDELITNVYGKGYQLQVVVSVAPNRTLKPYLIGLLTIGILAYFIVWLINSEQRPQLTDENFEKQIAMINSGQSFNTLDLSGLSADPKTHPSDQLKVAYLQGLSSYKSGDYDRSIQHLLGGIKSYGNGPSIKPLANAYLLLSKMFIYRSDKSALQHYLTQAKTHFASIEDQAGLVSTAISKARYHQAVFQFDESIEMLEGILANAIENNDTYNQMRAISNLAYSFEQTKQTEKYIQALEQTLSLALETADGSYAAYAYGTLSQIYMQQAQFEKAMKFAQQALKYVLEQHDTNNFQQGYSAFYNILHELGHHELAQSHLQSAIDLQAHFNDESLLVLAEINLAKLNTTLAQHGDASDRLKKLLTTDLTKIEQLEISALHALNSYFRQDNITAYTEAKRVYETTNLDDKLALIAGTALAFSSHQLERNEEAIKVFNQIKPLANQDWLIAYTFFLDLAELVYTEITPNETELLKWSEAKLIHTEKKQKIRNITRPDTELVNQLNNYINQILQ